VPPVFYWKTETGGFCRKGGKVSEEISNEDISYGAYKAR
jgi:hypothetical protein